MFKEMGVVVVLIIIFYLILLAIQKRDILVFIRVLIGSLVILLCLNVVYNLKYVFPNYEYENVSIGDCKENLFTYKADSQFGWQILFPLLKNRNVQIYDKREIYTSFMQMYASSVQAIELEDSIIEQIENRKDWSLNPISLSMFLLLDYAFPDYEYDDVQGFPVLNICFDGLTGSDKIVAYVDENKNLYLMSKDFLEELKQEVE